MGGPTHHTPHQNTNALISSLSSVSISPYSASYLPTKRSHLIAYQYLANIPF